MLKVSDRAELDYLMSNAILPAARKGEWWYEHINNWNSLEEKQYGKSIAINIKTGEYVVAATLQEAMNLAKDKFGSVPLFTTYIHRYVADVMLQIITKNGETMMQEWHHRGRTGKYLKECERLYAKIGKKIKKELKELPRHAHAIISVDRGKYVIGNDPWIAEEKAKTAFPVIGKGASGPSTLNGKAEYVPW